MAQQVRVRYAPSPTGEPHIGNIRTALFNWLFARHHQGAFVVRIEDTDRERYVEGAVERILEGLRWLGLDWDEGPQVDGSYGPYVQSERKELYHRYAMELREQGYAYHCYCSPRRLEAMRREQQRQGRPPGYDRLCRDLSPEERQRSEAENATPVVRFKVPLSGETTFQDAIRGPVVFQNGLLDDFVVLKSDGFPTYHLASVVDDHLMEMSHVIRGEEWLSSTPRHVLLYEALEWEHPIFAHLPMILGPDRAKLSKRHGATSVLEYKEAGYLPDALVNFMALLGWSLDDRTELLLRGELVQHFSLERVSRSAAIFNQEKLQWMNGVYLRQMGQKELAERLIPFLERGLPPKVPRPLDRAYLRRIVPLVQERLKLLGDAVSLTGFFFVERLEYDASLLLQVFREPLQ
ncbi:MAG: glutamate--tRNA ligase, partial [Dehalococcoidia bacterium]